MMTDNEQIAELSRRLKRVLDESLPFMRVEALIDVLGLELHRQDQPTLETRAKWWRHLSCLVRHLRSGLLNELGRP